MSQTQIELRHLLLHDEQGRGAALGVALSAPSN